MAQTTTAQLQKWIDSLQDGDATARNELFNHASERLRRLARRVFGRNDRLRAFVDSGDVLQNAVLRLMRTLQSTSPQSVAEFFWMASRAMRQELIDLARHHYGPQGSGAHRATPAAADATSETVAVDKADSTYEPAQLADWTEFHEQVEALDPEEREVFDLLWYQGLTQEDAAAVLQISLSTVKRRWLAARLRFQESLFGQ
jgi:RNA polymerase sigma-70 factor (ECF subfamily)